MSDRLNGKYLARAVEWEFGIADNEKKTPFMKVEFNVTDLDERITWFGWLSEAAAPRTMEGMRYCGWDNDDVTAPTGMNAHEIELVIEPETYKGKTQSRVKYVNRAPGLKTETLDEAKKREFAARMKAAAVASRSGMPKKVSAPPPNLAPQIDPNDKPPF